jgi:hypothetical protein
MGAAAFSSAIVFHAPQASHRPDHLAAAAPQDWQTKFAGERAISKKPTKNCHGPA